MLENDESFTRYTTILKEYLPLSGPAPLAADERLAGLGLDSLNTVSLLLRLEEEFEISLPDEALTAETFATVGSLWSVVADHLTPSQASAIEPIDPAKYDLTDDDLSIAIIGMAGRFPGAADVATLSENIRGGVHTLTRFTDEELLESGVDPALVADPNYVKDRPVLDDIKGFDADFFGYNPREAKLADPQQRVFLECAWEALELAGYATADDRGRVGVFGGGNLSTYAFDRFTLNTGSMEITPFELIIGNDKDALSTIISYKLNLTGPSVSVQTFCSTSGSAIHFAVQSLRRGECEMALAGGVCIRVPDKIGYLYQEGGQESPDGFLRTFDVNSQGGVFGDGAAVVVLKPLRQAMADRDTVLAVIRGSAMTNDGAMKFSYTAPSVVGQGQAVAAALADARVDPADVTYVEAHGTATELGDPIEVAGLTRGYGDVGKKQYCAIGSVKTNVGHLDRAAGVTGLIKIVESMRHEMIPALLHFTSPNPEIDFANSPFFPAAETMSWPRSELRPRIAGLNSLGVGGTNVHVVVQEADEHADRPVNPRRWQFLPVSARTENAVQESCGRLGGHLDAGHAVDLADIAFTLQAGRQLFNHRRVAVVDSVSGAATVFGDGAKGKLLGRSDTTHGRNTAFLLAGVGEHYAGMAAELYEQEPTFRAYVQECQSILDDHNGLNVTTVLTEAGERDGAADLARLMGRATDTGAESPMNRTEIAQPAVFVAEYALAKTLMDWGVTPSLLVGYSVGEYVAACLAGVLSLSDALRLVAHRAELIAAQPRGAMLAVGLSPDALRTRVPDLHERGLDVATLNGAQLVVAGPIDAVGALAEELRAERVACRELETTHAFHSRMLAPVAEPLTVWIKDNVTLNAPTIPYISNVTGELATPELVTDPGYWAKHMCGTVRFAECLATALGHGEPAFVEIGAGKSLGAMLRTHPDCGIERWPLIVSTQPGAAEEVAAGATLTTALAKLWLAGVGFDWHAYHGTPDTDAWRPGRVHLPTYPFQRQEHWWESAKPRKKGSSARQTESGGLADQLDTLPRMAEDRWLHLPVWRQTAPRPPLPTEGAHWLIYTDAGSRAEADALAGRLRDAGHEVTYALLGDRFADTDDGYLIRPGSAEDTLSMLTALRAERSLPARVVHLWTMNPRGATVPEVIQRGLHTLVALARTMQEIGVDAWKLDVVGTGTHQLSEDEPIHPDRATVIGPCRMIPVEYAQAAARLIDFPAHEPVPVGDLMEELLAEPQDRIVALRRGRRFVPTFDTVIDSPPTDKQVPIRTGGVYLVTGGLGGIGQAMAERLAEHHQARLVLFGRTPVPPREQWDAILADAAAPEEVRRRLEGLRRLESLGIEFELVAGDVADPADVRRAVAVAIDRFGELNGVLHAAGVPGVGLMQFKSNAEMDRVLAPKVAGTLALADALADVPIDFLVLFSSIASATGALGQTDYCAANVFLDGFAQSGALPQAKVVSIGWGEWTWNGWTAGLAGYEPALREYLQQHRAYIGISFDEGWRALRRVLAGRHKHVIVNTQDFATMVEESRDYTMANVQAAAQANRGAGRGPRPDLSTQFIAPQSAAERTIAEIWCDALGLEKVGTEDNFFELGGTSLIGVGIMDTIRRALKLDELAPHVLYQAPTVGGLAGVISGAASEKTTDVADRTGQQRARQQRRRELQRSGRQS
ncbi:SDR family NAD(P)-dependent oxidoreductase [Actinokineospora sp.]|uniref:SDR family NAD(P)-dependent oxidoreductase n=1 Tax=Actinokineospora sp. TaxID=1872133 RepID=UPI0040380EF3